MNDAKIQIRLPRWLKDLAADNIANISQFIREKLQEELRDMGKELK